VLTELVTELKNLRKGRGLFVSRIEDRVGAALRDVCGVTGDDGPVAVRQKVAAWLENLAGDLPDDLRVAVLAAYGICPDARLPLYQDRVNWAATRLDRDPRTARRRVDDGILQLAQLATRRREAAQTRPHVPETGWHTSELRVMLALDRDRPEAIEQRRIVSDQDGLTELDLPVTLASPGGLETFVFYGGRLADLGMESSVRHSFALRLPRPLNRGETHDIALHFRLPDHDLIRPYFVCLPKRSCELFDLRIRFDPGRTPARIWVLTAAFERDLDDRVHPGKEQPVDASGEVHLTFHHLMPGLAYGARWDP
jgi:hypothetical protein